MKLSDETISNIIKILVTIIMACIVYFAFSESLFPSVDEIKERRKEIYGDETDVQESKTTNTNNVIIKKVEVDGHSYIYTEKKFKMKDWGGYNDQYSVSLVHDENCKCKTKSKN